VPPHLRRREQQQQPPTQQPPSALAPIDEAQEQNIKLLLEECIVNNDPKEAKEALAEYNNTGTISPTQHYRVVAQAVQIAIDRKEAQRAILAQFIAEVKDLLTPSDVVNGFNSTMQNLEDIEMDAPLASKNVGNFIGHLIAQNAFPVESLKSLLDPLADNGRALKIATDLFKVLLRQEQGEELAVDIYKQSGINLLKYMKPDSRNQEALQKHLAANQLTLLGA
jgi:hypothetical protein